MSACVGWILFMDRDALVMLGGTFLMGVLLWSLEFTSVIWFITWINKLNREDELEEKY